MKNIFTPAFSLLLLCFGCGSEPSATVTTFEVLDVMVADTVTSGYALDINHSFVSWMGFKPGGEQMGRIAFSHGSLDMNQQEIVGGRFSIDMNTISVERLSADRATKLADHLKNSDFFEVPQFPYSTFEIVSVDSLGWGAYPYQVVGNLTMKDITRAISFSFDYIQKDGFLFVTTQPIILNRTQWGITYKSSSFINGLKDNFIDDNIQIQIAALFILQPN
ncbi:MAG: YceI family protein [Rikenellaceae bacterium]